MIIPDKEIEECTRMIEFSSACLFDELESDSRNTRRAAAKLLSSKNDESITSVAREYLKSSDNKSVDNGITIIANTQCCDTFFYTGAIITFSEILVSNNDVAVRSNAAASVSDIYQYIIKTEDCVDIDMIQAAFVKYSIPALVHRSNDESQIVRESIAYSLANLSNPKSIDCLLNLSGDSIAEVRSWATFGLRFIGIDKQSIREALKKRLFDKDFDVRIEAICALSELKDKSVFEIMRKELVGEDVSLELIEAAGYLQDKRLLANLKKLFDEYQPSPPPELLDAISKLEK